MGLCISTMRMMMLNAQKYDLEYNIQLITEAKMHISNSVADLIKTGTNLDTDSPAVKEIEARKERLYLMEKKLDAQLQYFGKKLQAVETEMQAVDRMVNENIKSSFNYGMGR